MTPKRTILPNGLRVITVPLRDSETVTVLSLVQAGSNYEERKDAGISHFLEHVCFKGTAKRPTSLHIAHELDSLGAESNAFTSNEYTGYYAKGQPKHVEKFVDIISDIYLNSTFPEAELEKEKGVILEEMNMYNDQPESLVDQEFTKLVYGDQPAGRPIIGFEDVIRGATHEQFVEYKKDHYSSKTTVIVVAGPVLHTKVVSLVKKYFAGISKGKTKGKKKVDDTQKEPRVHVIKKDTQQSHIVLGFRSLHTHHKDLPALSVLSGVLSGGFSSRLFQKFREQMGVCYYVYSHQSSYSDHGIFTLRAGVTNSRVEEVISEMMKEIERVKAELISEEELSKTKEYLASHMRMGLESSNSWAGWYGGEDIMGKKLETPAQKEKTLRAVTAKQIQAIAKKIFTKNNLNLAIIGPSISEEPLRKLVG
jgi:predicted Zn-dependent peptidase